MKLLRIVINLLCFLLMVKLTIEGLLLLAALALDVVAAGGAELKK